MNTTRIPMGRLLSGPLLALGLACGNGHAGDHERSRGLPLPGPYVQECAACHVAYAPGMLPAASWRRLMDGLDKHYGTDAALDPKDLQLISRWLQGNADTRRTSAAPVPEDRITRTAWFERKHRHIEPATWRLASVRSPSNCMACHTGADKGQYDDHALRMPAGLSPRQRANWDD